MHGDGGDFVPARASGRASLQEMWGLSSDRVTMIVSRVTERTIAWPDLQDGVSVRSLVVISSA